MVTIFRVIFTGILAGCFFTLLFLGGYLSYTYKKQISKVQTTSPQIKLSEAIGSEKSAKTSENQVDNFKAKDSGPSELPTKYILYHTTMFHGPFNWQPPQKCSKPCVFTNNSKLLESVGDFDALVFHARDLCFPSTELPDPATRRSNQVYILMGRESPIANHINYTLDRYKSFFNWTMSYQNKSDIPTQYGEYKPRKEIKSEAEFEKELEELLQKKRNTSNPVMWAVSNCVEHRMNHVKELMKYINVSVYGKCFNKFIEFKERQDLLKLHKFYLGFENAYCKEYITEKFWFALEFGTLPIALGATNLDYKISAPPNSFIYAQDFKTKEDLTNYIKFLDENDEEYKKYFQWRRYYDASTKYPVGQLCEICDKLHNPSVKPKSYENLSTFFREEDCVGRKSMEPNTCEPKRTRKKASKNEKKKNEKSSDVKKEKVIE